MDQDPQTPQDPAAPKEAPKPGVPEDISKILLPTKEVHGPQSAQRVNAGALLEQELVAATQGTKAQTPEAPPPVEPTPPAPAVPKKDESAVRSIETYQGDIENLVKDKNISVLSIASAEAERRGKAGGEAQNIAVNLGQPLSTRTSLVQLAMIAGGIILLMGAAGALTYIFLQQSGGAPAEQNAPQAPFIFVDDTKEVILAPGETRGAIMANLNTSRKSVNLALGLIARVLPEVASTTPNGQLLMPLSAQTFLTIVAPDIPPELLRTIQPTYLLGVHVFNDNQAFLIFKIDSYEQGYSGMLAWESNLEQDLLPLFSYTPRPRIPEEGVATSTPTLSPFIQTPFADKIVQNHDTRVLQNQYGDIYLLWTFLDRNTLVITTNEATLREIISRIQNAPITPIPGQ